ncbi:MAG: LL-diaminopimelate aminotransferase [Deltaproteobacteria bacterium]|nr:LL-diaminopimelate aminotransferase [Deltaproteobacteria bacterium]
MARINEHYLDLAAGYLFPEIGRRVTAFRQAEPQARILRLGVGDVALPLAPAVSEALQRAAAELATGDGFRGYGPERGYDFLIEAIRQHDYAARGTEIAADEIFISDGSKQDAGNLQEIFATACSVMVTDPVYPVYVDTNVMAGREIQYLPATEANGFAPGPPEDGARADLAYLCSPNNPTGGVLSRAALARWVAWARDCGAVLIFDAAYDAYISDPALPRSIYEVDGARECAIELRSFSKRAGFTGLRCAYCVVPSACTGRTAAGGEVSLRDLWARRQATKFNGVPYIVQRAAAAVFSPEGRQQTEAQIAYYMENARRLREGLRKAGFAVFGGEHAPYLWLRTPNADPSWDFFDRLLRQAQVVGTPGAGFGPAGEGYFRLSAFADRETVDEAITRIQRAFAHG